jgi:hypothetical protein
MGLVNRYSFLHLNEPLQVVPICSTLQLIASWVSGFSKVNLPPWRIASQHELDTCLSLGFEYQGLVVSRVGQSQGLAIDVLHNLDGLGIDLAIRGHESDGKCEAHFFLDQEV